MAGDPDTNLQPDYPERDDSAQEELRVADTKGNSITAGNVMGIGIAIGAGAQASVTITEEQAYKVSGLTNPYLGLRAFTAAERDIFAGRERIVRALVDRLSADNKDRLLFVVGASGSGKSSLARAGLLPDLADRLRSEGYIVQTKIIDHPGRIPATTLTRLFKDAPDVQSPQFLLILIDQFEEIFSHTDPAERDAALSFLADQAASPARPVRIIATMRSDFLSQLIADVRFDSYERRKVIVRAMNEEELQDAILRPIQICYPNKQIELALVKRLASDAALDAAYLPLLQVTLEDLWRGGELRLSVYHGLANAIQRRADAVYTYRDYDGLQQEKRTPEEQTIILGLFLDLVRVSLDDEQHDVRWRRSRSELINNDPYRGRLTTDLVSARLLRTDWEIEQESDLESRIETIDIVHEALLKEWPVLKKEIDNERELLRRRVRFDLALREWRANKQTNVYLLNGIRLSEAQDLSIRGDIVLQDSEAQKFFKRSVELSEIQRQRQQQRTRLALIVLTLTAALSIMATAWAIHQTSETLAQLKVINSQRLAFAAQSNQTLPETGVLLAYEAFALNNTEMTRSTLRNSLDRFPWHIRILEDHADTVSDATFSPDGKYILTTSFDHTARMWDVFSGQLLVTFRGHTDAVWYGQFNYDGSRILTVSADNTARLWDEKGRLIGLLTETGENPTSATFSADGRYVLTSSPKGVVRVFAADTAQPVTALQGHTGDIKSVHFSPNGQLILTASADNTARLWDSSGHLLTILGEHKSPVTDALFNPDGTRILTISDIVQLWDAQGHLLNVLKKDGVLSARFSNQFILTFSGDSSAQLWNAYSGDLIANLQGHKAFIASITISPDGTRVLTASDDYTARIWDTQGRLLAILNGHTSWVRDARFNRQGTRILTRADDGTARIWNPEGQLLAILHSPTGNLISAEFSPDGNSILTTGGDKTARLWSLTSGQSLVSIRAPSLIESVDFSADGKKFLTNSGGEMIQVWDALSGHLLFAFQGRKSAFFYKVAQFSPDGTRILTMSDHLIQLWNSDKKPVTLQGYTSDITSAIFIPDGLHILTISTNQTVQMWDATSGQLITVFQGHSGTISKVVYSPDSSYILTISGHTAQIWNAKSGHFISSLEEHSDDIVNAIFIPSTSRIITLSTDGTIKQWNDSGKLLNTVHIVKKDENFNHLTTFSPNGDRILSISWNTAHLWSSESGQLIATLQGHTSAIEKAVFSSDDKYILTSSWDHTVRLWNAQSGEPIFVIQGHTKGVTDAVFSPDGLRILTASADGTARIYPLLTSDLLNITACNINRKLSEDEIRTYNLPAQPAFNSANYQCPPHFDWEK